jgi:ribosome-binding factor A
VVAGLERSAPFLKGLLAREVQLRNTPNLAFALDDSFDRADRISALLTRPEVARDLKPQAAEAKTLTNNGADDE